MTTPLAARAGPIIMLDDDAQARSAAADPAAFAPLYERHVDAVYRYVRSRGASPDEAADLTAIAFERAIVSIGRYRPRGAGFAAWVLRIARNAAIDAERRRRPAESLDALMDDRHPTTDESTEATVLATEERRELIHLLRRLRPLEQEAIALRYASGLTSAEIGAVIGKSESATKKLITRALTTLKESHHVDH